MICPPIRPPVESEPLLCRLVVLRFLRALAITGETIQSAAADLEIGEVGACSYVYELSRRAREQVDRLTVAQVLGFGLVIK